MGVWGRSPQENYQGGWGQSPTVFFKYIDILLVLECEKVGPLRARFCEIISGRAGPEFFLPGRAGFRFLGPGRAEPCSDFPGRAGPRNIKFDPGRPGRPGPDLWVTVVSFSFR